MTQLLFETDQGRSNALLIYEKGAFSTSVAQVTLSEPLAAPLTKNTTIIGFSSENLYEVKGEAYNDYQANETFIEIRYMPNIVGNKSVECQVGGNIRPITDGCTYDIDFLSQEILKITHDLSWNIGFEASGRLMVSGFSNPLEYTYSVLDNNVHKRTIQTLSLHTKENFYECPNCPYEDYSKFIDYYGRLNYADLWVLAAFNGTITDLDRGIANFSKYEGMGRSGKELC